MMNCWAGLRRGALGAVLGAASLLVGCGGASSFEPFVPQRLIVLGDESSVLNSDGTKYSVNALNATDTSLLDCAGNPIWVQVLANSYQLAFPECQRGTATISAGGLATGLGAGSPVTIIATSGSISGAAALRVTSALVSIQVAPATRNIAAGTTQQFTATGTYSDSTTQDLTSQVAWTSSAASTATVSATGLATGVAAGAPVTITATSGSISGAASLTVSGATLASIQVTPATPNIAAGTTQQFTATGIYSDLTTHDLTASVAWTSSATGTATVSAGGLATGVALGGPVTITATSGSISGAASLTVSNGTLVSIQVTPATKSIATGTTQQFTATGIYSDLTTRDLTSWVAWTSSATGTATLSAAGLATGVAAGGPVTITATSGSISGAASLTVSSATLVSIQVTPQTPSIAAGATQQFTATGTFSNSTTQDLTAGVAWTSSATGTATVSSSGLATGVAAGGPVTITATWGSISGAATLTVATATLLAIQVTPTTQTIAAGTTQQFTATGLYSDASTKDLTAAVKWTSSATDRAPVKAQIVAVAGAKVSDIAQQIGRVGGFVEKDLVTLLAGANDIFAQYALIKSGALPEGSCTEPPNTTCTGAMAVVHATGEALAAQVNQIAQLGGRVLISTVPDLGLTPFARSEEALAPGSAARLTRLTKEFNVRLRLNIINDGRRIGLLLIDETVQAAAKNPASVGLINAKDAVCIAGLAPTACTSLTLVTAPPLFPPATAGTYLWANDRLFSAGGHSLLGNLAYSRASRNPF